MTKQIHMQCLIIFLSSVDQYVRMVSCAIGRPLTIQVERSNLFHCITGFAV